MKKCAIGIALTPARDQVLLVKRRDLPVWVLPGGGIEEGELPEQAALREFQEETGLHALIVRQVAAYVPINRLSKETYTFECEVQGGEATPNSEAIEVRYFPLKQLPKNLFFLHREWLQDALKNAPSLIHKPLSSVNYRKLLQYACSHPLILIRYLFLRLRGDTDEHSI